MLTEDEKNILAHGDASRARISLYMQSHRTFMSARTAHPNDCQSVRGIYSEICTKERISNYRLSLSTGPLRNFELLNCQMMARDFGL